MAIYWPFSSGRTDPVDRCIVLRLVLSEGIAAHRRLADEGNRRARRGIYAEPKDVETVVIADDIVALLRLDAVGEIDVLVEQAFILRQRVAEPFTGGATHHGNTR